MEVRPRDEQPLTAFLEVVCRPAIGVAGTKERLLESQLLSAIAPSIRLDNYPRTCIQLNIQTISLGAQKKGGSVREEPSTVLSTAINAATLALLDAGTAMRYVVLATDVVVKEGSRHTLAFSTGGELVFVDSQGRFEEGELEEAVKRGREECRILVEEDEMEVDQESGKGRVGEIVRKVVEGKVGRELRLGA